ncbi:MULTISPECIES: glycerol-3-phosphate 1-O-acyltransferase PlsY [unclassified Adlercreutzia]|uniref:glycerol-3-phosphate 1-O-acyltransferase PlsY n=1 Tax=unclassified Adlercreutzia TaxID=2636013 RepID=UPI001F14FD9C|nr:MULTISPECIES: glycerol-3-phosphate 1-O-acyltransferase PlsY [unclassified Adlercreutzia]
MMSVLLLLLLLFVISYLLGSIPWGLIISKVFFKTDIRKQGSGNIGATNAVRAMGAKGGIAVFVLDMGKGIAAGALAWFVFGEIIANNFTSDAIRIFAIMSGNVVTANAAVYSDQVNLLCASVAFLGCVVGHIFSPWLKFHGGKGISVAFGCEFFALTPIGALIDLAVFIVGVAISRKVSVGSIAAAVVCPFIAVWICWNCWFAAVFISIAALLVIWAHRGNIKRLLNGDEPRFGKSSNNAKRMEDQIEALKPRSQRREEERRAKKRAQAAEKSGNTDKRKEQQ